MDIRKLEKTKKFGYLFWISYNGLKFDSFDENKNKKTVKSEFIKKLNELGVTWAKGVQQAGRTDAGVSADENILYISSSYSGDLAKLIIDFNKDSKYLKINKIEKTLPDLVLPDMVESREYKYLYPSEKVSITTDEIKKTCENLSGTYDVSEFTDIKGIKLKEKVRSIEVSYLKNGELYFKGNSFMPKQVRIMSAFILSGEKKVFPAKYLTLAKINIKQEFEELFIKKIEDINIENIEKVEKIGEVYIFYVKKENKSQMIGKRGKNIKKLRKEFGEIVIKGV